MDNFTHFLARLMYRHRSRPSYPYFSVLLLSARGACVLMATALAMALTACNENPTTPLPQLNTNALSPAQALNYGRQSAIYQEISHYWKLESINNFPVSYPFYLDLRTLNVGVATASAPPPCAPIEMTVDVKNIDKNQIVVIDIQRVLDACSNEVEDNMMAILADSKSIMKHPNDPSKLVLTSRQDTLIFVLAQP